MVVLVVGLVLSAAGGRAVQDELERHHRQVFHQVAVEAREAVEGRVAGAAEILFGLRGLFAAGSVSRTKFRNYAAATASADRLPGLIAVSFDRRVRRDELAAFEAQVRADPSLNPAGAQGFSVHPHPGGEAIVVDYLEPLEGNEKALGFDVASEPVRRVALEEARDSGDLVATAPIVLVQGQRPGFLVLLAIYASPIVPPTDPARRRGFLGTATAVFDTNALLVDVLGKRPRVTIEIYDVGSTVDPASSQLRRDRLVFDNDRRHQDQSRLGPLYDVVDLNVAGRRWRLVATAQAGFVSRLERRLPALAGLAGVVLSLLAAGLTWSSGRVRRQRRESTFRSFLELAPDAVVVVDVEGRVVRANAQAEKLFGYREDELVGRPVEAVLPERLGAVHEAHRRAYVANGPVARPMGAGLELVARHKDGTERPVDISLGPLETDEGLLVAAAIRDTTERKRLEALRDEFIANAAHELRTPLTTLTALGEILAAHLHEMTPEQVSRSLVALERQGRRANTLVANLLDLSQLRGGRTRLTVEAVDLAQAAKRALEAAPPPDTATVDVSVRGDLAVWADAGRLEQILINLLTNAYRYGGRRVVIRAAAEEDSVLVAVCDNGDGVPPDLVPQVFEPFTRGPNAERHGGSGIGLALCRGFVEALGGEIWYEAAQPIGACFTLRLPYP